MDSQLTGSNELLYVQTEKVSVTIKGKATHPNFQGIEYKSGDSSIKVHCVDDFQIALRDGKVPQFSSRNGEISTGIYSIYPMFYEQQQYEIVIEAVDGHKVAFWHDNLNVRNKVTRASRNHEILSGVINFGNEIGFSDLVIQIDGVNYLRLVIEVFPTKIDYQNDYKQIVEDVTKEVYNVVFDFLKKTYLGYQQSDKVNSSPVEFFAVINKIYKDFIKAADIILSQPHHVLETTHQVLPSHKVKKTDSRTIRWIEKHPDQAKRVNGDIRIERALAVRKQVSYDTKENQLTKYILLSTARKLESFKKNYLKLQRKEDQAVISMIDGMVKEINRQCNTTFLADVEAKEASSGMSLVFSMAPGYRDLYKYYLMLLRGLSITGDVFNISVKDLALLYEYWCFIKINSMMKDRYQLISQDIVKVQGNGLFVSLVKGSSSKVKYRNPENGELITLSYNPKSGQVPTVAQKPDNVLSLEKKTVNQAGKKVKYEYVFDAKYRVNPALEGSDYYNTISHTPGPETDDINTMHRYRDAIVYHNGADPYERTMFGAYVLFPYANKEEYRGHKFFESIEKVNIGGLPFLPSETSMVQDMLDALIADSPDSAFERATLPRGIEDKLAKIDWNQRDVLVGALRNRAQLDTCLKHKFYHIPASKIKDADLPIHYVAIYQSINIFGREAGIRYYGEVTKTSVVKRRDIREIPKNSDEAYYRFEIKEWKELNVPLTAKEVRDFPFFTNMFLLQHCPDVPDLHIGSEEEYRLYTEVRRLANDTSVNETDAEPGFKYDDKTIIMENGDIVVLKDGTKIEQISIETFIRKPRESMRMIAR